MLKNMGQAGVVNRSGEKGEIEHAVSVVICNIQELCPGTVVLKENNVGTEERKLPDLLYGETFNSFPESGQS